jgi:hypothetical protein
VRCFSLSAKAIAACGRSVAKRLGDAINAALAAAGYNFRRLLTWLRLLLAWIAYMQNASNSLQPA